MQTLFVSLLFYFVIKFTTSRLVYRRCRMKFHWCVKTLRVSTLASATRVDIYMWQFQCSEKDAPLPCRNQNLLTKSCTQITHFPMFLIFCFIRKLKRCAIPGHNACEHFSKNPAFTIRRSAFAGATTPVLTCSPFCSNLMRLVSLVTISTSMVLVNS